MPICASVVKNPGFCMTNMQKNTREHKNLRTCDLHICVPDFSAKNHSCTFLTNPNTNFIVSIVKGPDLDVDIVT